MLSAEGWTRCGQGHRHWGRLGAAGLLLVHVDPHGVTRYLLQHRSARVQHGLTWGIPGGALEPDETPIAGALREAREEFGPLPDDLAPVSTTTDDHGGWAYTTVSARTRQMITAKRHGWETGPKGFQWFTAEEVTTIQLHPGLTASFQ